MVYQAIFKYNYRPQYGQAGSGSTVATLVSRKQGATEKALGATVIKPRSRPGITRWNMKSTIFWDIIPCSLLSTDISEEDIAHIFRAQKIS
jgi:hypothetical protein